MAQNKRRRNRAARSRKKIARKRSSVTRSSGTSARSLNIEQLEDRRLLAIFTVTTQQDLVFPALDAPVAGSLRQAIIDANDTLGPDTIVFDPNVFSASTTMQWMTAKQLASLTTNITTGTTSLGAVQLSG